MPPFRLETEAKLSAACGWDGPTHSSMTSEQLDIGLVGSSRERGKGE
jgi:hypothetical protein